MTEPPDPIEADASVELQVFAIAKRLGELSRSGLMYVTGEFDRERYETTGRLAAELMGLVGPITADALEAQFAADFGYATPKVDVRAAVFDAEDRILLVRERADGLWTLPGGWADAGDTPAAAVTREVEEETGLTATAVRLIGCWDRDTQGNVPRLPVSIYKLFFLCTASGAVDQATPETEGAVWYDPEALPPLSITRVTPAQVQRCLAHHLDPSLPAEFD